MGFSTLYILHGEVQEVNDLTVPKDFQTRLAERIKEQIPELMTTEEMKKLVDKVCNDFFFTRPRVNKGNDYNPRWEETPSFADKFITELVKDEAKVQIKQWLDEHPDEVRKILEAIVTKSMGQFVVEFFRSLTDRPLQDFYQSLRTQLNANNIHI